MALHQEGLKSLLFGQATFAVFLRIRQSSLKRDVYEIRHRNIMQAREMNQPGPKLPSDRDSARTLPVLGQDLHRLGAALFMASEKKAPALRRLT